MFCRHDWEVKDKTILLSAYEQVIASGQAPASLSALVPVFQKTVVLVLACKKCGKLKKFMERGPMV